MSQCALDITGALAEHNVDECQLYRRLEPNEHVSAHRKSLAALPIYHTTMLTRGRNAAVMRGLIAMDVRAVKLSICTAVLRPACIGGRSSPLVTVYARLSELLE